MLSDFKQYSIYIMSTAVQSRFKPILMIFDEYMFHKSDEYPRPPSCLLFRPGIRTRELQGENKLNFYIYQFVQIYFDYTHNRDLELPESPTVRISIYGGFDSQRSEVDVHPTEL